MAKIDGNDASFLINQAAFAQLKPDDEKRTKNIRQGGRKEKTEFSKMMDSVWGRTADQIGPLSELPVSEEAINLLMDEVRSTGDVLVSRPFSEEILNYKQAVRNFLNYVVKNGFTIEREEGIPHFLKKGFKGRRGTPEAMEGYAYTKIQIIDNKLEEMAAMLLSRQMDKLMLLSRLDEIRGLLIDLLQ